MKILRHPTLFKYAFYLPTTWLAAPEFGRARHALERSQYFERARLEEMQVHRLRELIAHARAHVPHYRDLLRGANEHLVETSADVKRLPFTTKEMLRSRPDAFTSSRPGLFATTKTTGGSTGEPLTIPKTRTAMSWELAATWRGYSWAGIGIGDRQARFWGVPHNRAAQKKAWLIDFVSNRKRLSAFSFDEGSLEQYDRELRRFQPLYFYGYVSMLVQFAEFYRRTGLSPEYELRCIITTSEVLTKRDRSLLEDVFRTRVFDEYGCGELGTVAHECPSSRLHLNSENLIVEILDGDREVDPGESGELVITELANHAMPLVRYRTGDYATRSVDVCDCGRGLHVIDGVHGRAYDMLESGDGRTYHAEFMMYIFEDARRRGLGIGRFQVRQVAVDDFRIRIVPEDDYGAETEAYIVGRIQESFGAATRVEFERVADIPRERSGKLRVIVGMGAGNS